MRKHVKKWLKQEKQIVRLLYRKGLISDSEVQNLGWEYYRHGVRVRRRKGRYGGYIYLPEMHYYTWDSYNYETDSSSIVDRVTEGLWWDNHNDDDDPMNYDWGTSKFKYKGRQWFIKYLKALPTVRCDSKINKVLIKIRE